MSDGVPGDGATVPAVIPQPGFHTMPDGSTSLVIDTRAPDKEPTALDGGTPELPLMPVPQGTPPPVGKDVQGHELPPGVKVAPAPVFVPVAK